MKSKTKTTTMFTIALTIAVIGGSMAIPAMLTQYADAARKCTTDSDTVTTTTCTRGEGGRQAFTDSDGNEFTSEGGSGGRQQQTTDCTSGSCDLSYDVPGGGQHRTFNK
jgi:hypothetical protein